MQIISDLCAPYGIRVICEIKDFNSKIVNFTVNPGEKVVDSINRLLTKDNLIVTDNEFGDLVISEVGSNGNSSDSLTVGKIFSPEVRVLMQPSCLAPMQSWGSTKDRISSLGKELAKTKVSPPIAILIAIDCL